MYIVALATVVIIYPFLHEMGHYLVALFVGAEIVEISFFPISYVEVLLPHQNVFGQAIVGMAGMLFPMIICFVKPRRLTECTIVYTILLTNILAWLFSCSSIVAKTFGWKWSNEDVLTVITCMGGGELVLFLLCSLLLITCVYVFAKSRPLSRMMSFF